MCFYFIKTNLTLREKHSKNTKNTKMSDPEITRDFEQMDLPVPLLRGIYALGLEKPSRPQQLGIVPGVKGQDLLLQSQSGTGKTVTFSTISLSRAGKYQSRVLILNPNRDLANQTYDVLKSLSKYMINSSKEPLINIHLSVGGYNDMKSDSEKLKCNPHIVIGTIGRIEHQMKNGNLDCSNIELVIIDEADEMLKSREDGKSFKDNIKFIYKNFIKESAQTILISATYNRDYI